MGKFWPRGFPLDRIKDPSTSTAPWTTQYREVGVLQSLADNDPDVDAIYRLTGNPLPFFFEGPRNILAAETAAAAAAAAAKAPTEIERATAPAVPSQGPELKQLPQCVDGSSNSGPPEASGLRKVSLPVNTMMPTNAQASLHAYSAFWGLLLPSTVHGRVSDIWRGYLCQRLMWNVGLVTAFSQPWVAQYRNPHSFLGDLQAEQPLYRQSGQLIDALINWQPTSSTLPGQIEEAYIFLYELRVLEARDVKLVQDWIADLLAVGYDFPALRQISKAATAASTVPLSPLNPAKVDATEVSAASPGPGYSIADMTPRTWPPACTKTGTKVADAAFVESVRQRREKTSMERVFLNPRRNIPNISVLMSIRSSKSFDDNELVYRDFHLSWLHFWPATTIGELVIVHEPKAKGPVVLGKCLQSSTARHACGDKFPIRTSAMLWDQYFPRGLGAKTRNQMNNMANPRMGWHQMQWFKHEADLHTKHPIIALTDDDSCMFDHVLPSELVTDEGRLVAKGAWEPTMASCNPQWPFNSRVTNEFIGIYGVDFTFMVEFPVFVWRDMLVDFRTHIIRHVDSSSKADGNDLRAYWTAVQTLVARGWDPSDYANLLGFAFASRKWRDRYEWQIAGFDGLDTWPALSTGAHWRSAGCPVPQRTTRDRDAMTFAEASKRPLFYPSSASAAVTWFTHKSTGQRWESQSRSRQWSDYVKARQTALREWADMNPGNISVAEVCGNSIATELNHCFVTARGAAPLHDHPAPEQSSAARQMREGAVPARG